MQGGLSLHFFVKKSPDADKRTAGLENNYEIESIFPQLDCPEMRLIRYNFKANEDLYQLREYPLHPLARATTQ